MSGTARFPISDVEVEIAGLPAEVAAGLRVCWGACEQGALPVARRERFVIEARDDGYWIFRGGEHVGGAGIRRTLLPAVERAIYASLPLWHPPPRTILHAAALARGEQVLVLAGESGAGKSSLARALVLAGADYLTDELVITDGTELWGIPRAIQFGMHLIEEPRPWWLGEVDLASYRIQSDRGDAALALWPPPREQVRPGPFPAAAARVVLIELGDHTALRPASAVEALAALHAGAFSPVETDLGRLVGAPPMHLVWDRPDAAAALLLALLG